MKHLISVFTMLSMVIVSIPAVFSHDDDHENKITPMIAAERALHRIERLASVRMLDKSFVRRLENVKVTENVETDRYTVDLQQLMSEGEDGEAGIKHTVVLFMGYGREFLGYQILDYKNYVSTPLRPVTTTYIAEQAIHAIEDFIEDEEISEDYANKFETLVVAKNRGYTVVITQKEEEEEEPSEEPGEEPGDGPGDGHDDHDHAPSANGALDGNHEAPSITLFFDAQGEFLRYIEG